MPSDLKTSDINSQTDPSVARQYDDETPKDQQMKQFYEMCDGKKICMLSTYRKGTGTISHAP
jgi:abnormal spindle-like microcephaly-associated protein